MKYASSNTYPEVKVERENIFYAHLLLNDYTGYHGELTAITQYVFQNFNFYLKYPEAAHILSRIAIVEMHHLELLGKTIKLLGVDPVFQFQDTTFKYPFYWNSSFIKNSRDFKSSLKDDIFAECQAIKNYRKHLAIIEDKYIKNLLMRIIEDEKMHIKCFEYLLNTL